MRVVLAQSARADLRQISDWIGRDDPRRAVAFVRELRSRCLSLAEQPFAFPIAASIGPNIHKRTHGRYLILYRVQNDRIEVVHVVHGARDYVRSFKRL